MSEFVKTKFFMVLVVLMIVLTVVPSVLAVTGAGGYVKNAMNVIVSPFQKLFGYATDAISGFTSYFTEFDRIVEENKQLREELKDLSEQISDAEETERMNEWLYRYLELKREHADYEFVAGSVTGRESGNYMTVFIIDKGTLQGVNKGMPAVTDYGVVGYVAEAGLDWCKVVTLLESDVAAGAYIKRTGETGIVEGDFNLAAEGLCKMTYISADSDVAVGDTIMTSGFGSVYPRGITLGYVESVEPDPNTQSLVAYIRPAQDMKNIEKLMIITAYEVVADE